MFANIRAHENHFQRNILWKLDELLLWLLYFFVDSAQRISYEI